ncbi:MAG TPA: hypothetical protein VLT91_00420 [Rhizomicrobium sp.]|nr:hypothetical protein [Rhizomicrobium sp.]
MTGSRNFLFALAAVVIVPFLLVLLPGATPGVPQLSAAPAPEAVSTEDAAAHDGRVVTVEGIAREVHVARSGSATFIDLDGTYPDQPFTAVIFADDMARVGDVSDLEGRTVDITGTIRMYGAGRKSS